MKTTQANKWSRTRWKLISKSLTNTLNKYTSCQYTYYNKRWPSSYANENYDFVFFAEENFTQTPKTKTHTKKNMMNERTNERTTETLRRPKGRVWKWMQSERKKRNLTKSLNVVLVRLEECLCFRGTDVRIVCRRR